MFSGIGHEGAQICGCCEKGNMWRDFSVSGKAQCFHGIEETEFGVKRDLNLQGKLWEEGARQRKTSRTLHRSHFESLPKFSSVHEEGVA